VLALQWHETVVAMTDKVRCMAQQLLATASELVAWSGIA